jgi:quercetin dioxygenase-like cupin family protein
MEHFEEICTKFHAGSWDDYRSFVPPGIADPLTQDEYYRIPVYKGECMVILMLWGPGATTALHDHGGSRGRVKVLKGSVTEERYTFDGSRLELISSNKGQPGDILNVSVNDIHSVRNHEDEMSVTLHVYETNSNSFEGTKIYDRENRRVGVLNGMATRATWREKPEAFSSITYFGR